MSLKLTTALLATTQLLTLTSQAKLAAWFPLNEPPGASETVREAVAGADGILVNADAISKGRTSFHGTDGTAYRLRSGGGIDIGSTAAVQPSDQFTIAFWFQPGSLNAYGRLVETQVGSADTQSGLRIDLGAAGNKVRALLRDGNGKNTQLTHSLVLKNDGAWYFVGVRYDSTLGDGTALKLTVIEAVAPEADAAAIPAATQSATALATGPLPFPHARGSTLIGLETESGNASNLDAVIDELAFYDNSDGKGILTDEELAKVYNHGPTGVKVLDTFTSAASNVPSGGNAALSWRTIAGLDSLTLLKNNETGTGTDLLPLTTDGGGTISIPQSGTTTYILRAAGGGGVNFSTVQVVTGVPVITSLTTSAALIPSGGGATLSWQAAGADTLTLNPGHVNVTGQRQLAVTPAENTVYTLTAANSSGSSSAEVLVRATSGPLPANSYYAAQNTNDETLWRDNTGTKNWPLNGLLRQVPLVSPSAVTGISGSYQATDHFSASGITVASFQYADATVELWVRPDIAALTADHQLIFESGGGQNGISVLINNTSLRFLGSASNTRTVDFTLPVAGLELGDFIQILYTLHGGGQKVEATVRDITGQVLTAEASGKVVIGTNAASLLALTGNQVDLGGRTDVAGTAPEGLTGFAGEIAILNLYNHALTAEENAATFKTVLPVTPSLVTSFETNAASLPAGGSATLTWRVAGSVDSLTLTDVTAGGAPVDLLPLTPGGGGTLAVSPTVPTTYTLKASKGGTVHSASVFIYAGPPVITSFLAKSTSLIAGESTTLTWNVGGADTVTLSPEGAPGSNPAESLVSPSVTTTYTLTATNAGGSSTSQLTVDVRPVATPVHRYLAASEGNDEFTWTDEAGGRNWPLNGVVRNHPLVKPSGFAGIGGSYQTPDSFSASGVTVPSFQYADFTVELWVRADSEALDGNHQIIFESGGGQNGSSVLLTKDGVRFLGSSGNVRNLDVVVPTAGLRLDDFIQIVYTVQGSRNQESFYLRDVNGKVVERTATGKVTHGTNAAGLFHVSGNVNNLGGRTELADVTPEGLTGFAGEIALLNVYDRALTAEAVAKAYNTVADSTTTPPVTPRLEVTSASYDPATNRITLAWDSKAAGWYVAEISNDLSDWTELGDPFQPATAGAAQVFQFPEGPKHFIRVREVAAP